MGWKDRFIPLRAKELLKLDLQLTFDGEVLLSRRLTAMSKDLNWESAGFRPQRAQLDCKFVFLVFIVEE